MNGFIRVLGRKDRWCADRTSAECRGYVGPAHQPDVMSFVTVSRSPTTGRTPTPTSSRIGCSRRRMGGLLPAHLFLVSGWSASCRKPTRPMSCVSNVRLTEPNERWTYGEDPIYAWTDITWLLNQHGVSWGYYVGARDIISPMLGASNLETTRPPERIRSPTSPRFTRPGSRAISWTTTISCGSRLGGDAALRFVGGSGELEQRASRIRARDPCRHGTRHANRERGHEGAAVGLLGGLPHLG